ncbi:hypothetical protein CANCADRAFT_15225, partial [Tortispora caseinolytica NRRL Y-17796]
MAKTQKKHSKGRLDKYYKLAKEKGYRARAAFKLLQINQKYGGFLQKSKVVLDLCAAPGSWCQVATQQCPRDSLIVGVDLVPMKPIPNVITFQEDITSDRCRAQIRQYLKTWKADTVLHDGAPNVGMAWVHDAYSQAELVLQSLKLATEFLKQNGNFITKVFRSKDYNNLMWVFNQFFDTVEATKPAASRDVSAEIFVVCRGYKAPAKIDPRLLDPRSVFEDDETTLTSNYETSVFHPEKNRRKREGYAENDYTLFHTQSVLEFIRASEPLSILATQNQLKFESANEEDKEALKVIKKLDSTTPEIKACCEDLKVLGKKDFRGLLKWRIACREALGLATKKVSAKEDIENSNAQTEPLDPEAELAQLEAKQNARLKREKKRQKELKMKEIRRREMGMDTPKEIGIEYEAGNKLFDLETLEKNNVLEAMKKGKMNFTIADPSQDDEALPRSKRYEVESDEDGDLLEEELDVMYEEFQERRTAGDPHKRARQSRSDEVWTGFDDKSGDSSDDDIEFQSDSDADDIKESREKQDTAELSKKDKMFYDQGIFNGLDDEESDSEMSDDDSEIEEDIVSTDSEGEYQNGYSNGVSNGNGYADVASESENDSESENSDDDIEMITAAPENNEEYDSDDDWTMGTKKPKIEIVTPEAMTLAHELALKRKSRGELADDAFNRYSFLESDGLPSWFVDDEKRFNKPNKPITKEAMAVIRQTQKQMNSRPIKKELEAKMRKRMRASKKIESMRKKSELILEDPDKSEKEKAETIQKIMRRATKKQDRPQITVVRAQGANRGLKGRPGGVKGRYKMVDGRMKQELRSKK